MANSQWKTDFAQLLKRLGVVDETFTGRVTINLNQGGVTEIEKTEKIEESSES
jgi:hypothetical protein